MRSMPNMLAFTINGGGVLSGYWPMIVIGAGDTSTTINPSAPDNDSYWVALLDANNPRRLVKEFQIPGNQNTQVPAGLSDYMSQPGYIYVVATQYLSVGHVPQGDFYNFLVTYGASRELDRLEQVNSSLGSGYFMQVGYVLIGQSGPTGGTNPPQPSYDLGTLTNSTCLMTMALMPMPDGSPPYSICDSNVF